jgi:hypothetical protein
MRNFSRLSLGFFTASIAAAAMAQAPAAPPARIEFDARQPTHFGDLIRASGKTSTDKNGGLTILSVTIDCAPVKGGLMVASKCLWKDGRWAGEISGLADGEYNLKATMKLRNGKGEVTDWAAPILKVTVKASGPIS